MDDLVPCEHQVAGWHNGSLSCVLKNKKGQILKPVKLNANPTYDSSYVNQSIKKDNEKEKCSEELIPVCRDEKAFYERVRSSTKSDDLALKALIPQYYGCQEIKKDDGNCTPHLILEDLAYGMLLPCVMDIKVGASQDYPNKGKVSKSKYATQDSHGFCLTGVRVFHPVKSELILDLRPDSCKQFTVNEVFDALNVFSQQSLPASKLLCDSLVDGLMSIKDWILEQRSYKIRRGSVLVLYDAKVISDVPQPAALAASLANGTSDHKEHSQKLNVVVKMIDFAHVFHAFGEQDDNYLVGLNNLIDYFSKFK